MDSATSISYAYQIPLLQITKGTQRPRKKAKCNPDELVLVIRHKEPVYCFTQATLPRGADEELFFRRQAAKKFPLILPTSQAKTPRNLDASGCSLKRSTLANEKLTPMLKKINEMCYYFHDVDFHKSILEAFEEVLYKYYLQFVYTVTTCLLFTSMPFFFFL